MTNFTLWAPKNLVKLASALESENKALREANLMLAEMLAKYYSFVAELAEAYTKGASQLHAPADNIEGELL